ARSAGDLSSDQMRRLIVTDARVDSGPTMKRFQPKDRGRAHAIKKRTSHITIAVDVK
ncbi:MAG: 50S ribosomal protein L22, partial [Phycisphaeraceae bacterium JB051]